MHKRGLLASIIFSTVFLFSCHAQNRSEREQEIPVPIINKEGQKIIDRFNPPEDYARTTLESHSFGQYLRQLKLKPHGSRVKYYNGASKNNTSVYCAVIDKPIGNRDLHQCADAIMRLKADYHFDRGEYDSIHFNFTNGFKAKYSKWRNGDRIRVNNNSVQWVNTSQISDNYESYWKYLEMVFSYAGTLSLSQELKSINLSEAQIGDIFIQGGSPGHAIIIVDECLNTDTGKKLYLFAQSYMPAQEIQVLQNHKSKLSPWYELDNKSIIETPEWTFYSSDLKRF